MSVTDAVRDLIDIHRRRTDALVTEQLRREALRALAARLTHGPTTAGPSW